MTVEHATSLSLLIALVIAGSPIRAQPQVEWTPTEYPIAYWAGPPVTHNTLEHWRTVKEAGFTLASPGEGYRLNDNRKMLDLCQELNLKAMVIDPRIAWNLPERPGWEDTVAQIVRDYEGHPALGAFFLQDEPSITQFANLAKLSAAFRRLSPRHLEYINLFPTYASQRQLGAYTYEEYLERFLTTVKPQVLSYDHYALLKGGSLRQDYFENLELIRQASQRAGIPPWNIILSWQHLGYVDPSPEQMRWQVYTSLAYGMKGLAYFVYWAPKEWKAAPAIVDAEGKPARLYPVVRQLNGEIKSLGRVLMGLKSTGAYHTGVVPTGCRKMGTTLPLKLPSDLPLLVGFFESTQGAHYTLIVNTDLTRAIEFEFTVKPDQRQDNNGRREAERKPMLISPADGTEVSVEFRDHRIRLQLSPGDGKLFRLPS